MTRSFRWFVVALLLAVAVLAFSAFSVAGCAGETGAKTTPATPWLSRTAPSTQPSILDPDGNVVLYVTNQSLALERVDIAIWVDDQPILDQDFSVGSQHDFERFVLRLSPGKHVLTAQSVKGRARLKRSFVVTGRRWIAVSYWYYTREQGTPMPRQLDFRIQDRQMVFD